MLSYQYKLSPTKRQMKEFLKQLEVHRNLYNCCLEEKEKTYIESKTNLTCFDQIKSKVAQFKGQSNYSSLQQTVRRLYKAYTAFFKHPKEFSKPRFKKRFRTIQFSKPGDGCKLHSKSVYIQGLGKVKCNYHRPIPTDAVVKTMSITFKDGSLYLTLTLDKIAAKSPQRNTSIGIDFGCKTTINLSNGNKINSPRFFNSKSKDIARLQRKKLREPENKHKIVKAIAKCYTKITNRRKDFNNKLTSKLVSQYDIICCEDLMVSQLTSDISNINRKWQDIAIGDIKNQLKYKAENAGKLLVLVNPAYTTQTCSSCGLVKSKELSERQHICTCGLDIDRDTNAALNILRLGLQSISYKSVEAT